MGVQKRWLLSWWVYPAESVKKDVRLAWVLEGSLWFGFVGGAGRGLQVEDIAWTETHGDPNEQGGWEDG